MADDSEEDGLLVLMPALTAPRLADGGIGLTRKFLDGVLLYREHWRGPIRLLIEERQGESENLDNLPVDPAELPFEVELVDYTAPELAARLAGAALVFGTTSYRQVHLPALCRSLGIPCVLGTEYTLRTRLQILLAQRGIGPRLVRGALWAVREEGRERRAIRLASGLQCNGTPTFDAYRHLQPEAHLFFDTRTRAEDVIAPERLEARLARLARGEPLRLAFSGRLDPMKGTQYLAPFAARLRDLGVPFRLDICGGGPIRERMARDIERLGLADVVHLRGVLDFQRELLPFVREEIDLFVCTHVQGDPSCTYLETFACGVPIVGFRNEAFDGLARRVGGCWAVPVRDVRALAQRVAALDAERGAIASGARAVREFALAHTFEPTFAGRVEHLRRCSRGPAPKP